MTLLMKDPLAALDYAVDWGAEYLLGDTLVDSSWSVQPVEPDGLSVVGSEFTASLATVTVIGGQPGHIYRLINHVWMASGREDSRSIILRVEER